MTIETAPEFPCMTYDEAVMYCFLLEHNGHRDWRLPTVNEYLFGNFSFGWYYNSFKDTTSFKCRVIPVRTL